jgi:hypothetical protein
VISNGKFVAFFNKKLDVNRFFDSYVEIGEGGEGFMPPAVEQKGCTGEEADTLFEDHLEDALCVFKTGGINNDILEQNEKQILLYINFEEEEVVDKAKYMQHEAKDDKIEGCHPVLFN